MTATIAIAPIGLMVLLVILAVFVVLKSGRGIMWTAPGRRPRKRHIVTRIICGVLGVLILGAIGIGTWQEVRHIYEPAEDFEARTVSVPTMPAPPLPEPAEGRWWHKVERARLLLHFVTVDASSGRFRPVHVDEHEVRWPEDGAQEYGTRFELYGMKLDYGVSLDKIQAVRMDQGEPLALELYFHHRFAYAGAHGSGTSTGSRVIRETVGHWLDIGYGWRPANGPLSVAPPARPDLQVFCVVTLVAADDPLRQVAATEFVRDREAAMLEAMSGSGGGGRVARVGRFDRAVPARGVALGEHIGTSSLLLLAATVLLTQLFKRRSLAFAGVLACMVLYVAVLDRAALGAHLSRLRDEEATIATRLTACAQARHTFFYRETTREALEGVAEAEDTPPLLREAAVKTAAELMESDATR